MLDPWSSPCLPCCFYTFPPVSGLGFGVRIRNVSYWATEKSILILLRVQCDFRSQTKKDKDGQAMSSKQAVYCRHFELLKLHHKDNNNKSREDQNPNRTKTHYPSVLCVVFCAFDNAKRKTPGWKKHTQHFNFSLDFQFSNGGNFMSVLISPCQFVALFIPGDTYCPEVVFIVMIMEKIFRNLLKKRFSYYILLVNINKLYSVLFFKAYLTKNFNKN